MAENIYQAIHEITHELKNIPRQSAQGLRYDVITEGAVLAAVKPHLQQRGVIVFIEEGHVELRHLLAKEQIKDDTVEKIYGTRADVTATVVFRHVESGTEIKVLAIGSGFDYSMENDAHKAQTRLVKNALLKTFLIETGDDGPPPNGGTGTRTQQRRTSGRKSASSAPPLTGKGKAWNGEDVIKAEGWLKSVGALKASDHRNHVLNILNLTDFEPGFTDELGDEKAEALVVGWYRTYSNYKNDPGTDQAGAALKANAWLDEAIKEDELPF